ncbi:hypothetical protein HAX54_024768 [Datura stramonium]|uniref:Uncharacterized protein n=1 Tax=Datura stramonium TaxID=4076 RepID=A0ABS8UYM0_DATST|nr:hypothetical protein [Datura stramonium]
MENSNADADEEEEVTFHDIKKNLKDYNVKELRSLACVLVDSFYDLTKEKKSLNQCIDELESEKGILITNLSGLEEKCQQLVNKQNNFIKKGGASDMRNVQSELEVELKRSQEELTLIMKRNSELEKDVIHLKAELEKSLKWNASS